MSSPAIPKTHNLPPVVAPTEQEVLDDLNARFPELLARLAEFEAALKEYPTEFTLADEDRASALQDLLGQIRKQKSIIAAHKKTEKGPWSKIVSVVTNLFDKNSEKLDGLLEEWGPRHQAYMDLKKAENLRRQEEEAEKQRATEEANRRAAAEAEERRIAAEKAEAEAREREEQARRDAEQAEIDRKAAEARAAAAAAEEKRLADEKKRKDREERDLVEANFKAIRRHMKDVDRLNDAAEAETVSDAEAQQLDAFVRPGGVISALATPIAHSLLLDDEQKEEITKIRTRLAELREAGAERLGKRERTRRAREAAEQEARDIVAAAARRKKREEEDAAAEEARKKRLAAEEEALAAKTAGETAKGEIREARTEARGAQQEQKAAGKVEKQATTDADRAGNRADRIEDRLENATDAEIAGTLRGDLGTKGSLTRRWTLRIMDDEALRAVLGPLGPHFTEDALNGAAYRWMLAHQAGWSGRERVDGELAGVVFAYQQGARIS